MPAGLLALVGGDEFNPGNEAQDRMMVAAAGPGPAYIVATAAARQRPDQAVAHAARWFAKLGLEVTELQLRRRGQADDPAIAARAAAAGFLYLCGGDPGLVPSVLRDSAAARAMVEAWHGGAVLAGSSAGAMALCEHVLVRERFPGHDRRRSVAGLGLIANAAVLPHHDTFGERWLPSAREALPGAVLIGVDERAAAVWRDGRWEAVGGAVTVHGSDGSRRFAAGSEALGIPQPLI